MSKPLPRSESLQRFCAVFNAEAERSPKRFRKATKLKCIDYTDPNIHYSYEEVDAIAIHIPTYRIDDFLGIVDEQKYRELEIRTQVPAVKLAYEHYKMLLKMCGVDSAGY